MTRFAAVDIGTNSVLLLVAERLASGAFEAVAERADITRLGRGVDATRKLSDEGMKQTLDTLERFVAEARALGSKAVAVTATSAARDASNGAAFLAEALRRTGVAVEIIAGEQEAQLSYAAVLQDWKADLRGAPLVVIDIGGGSTEFIYGGAGDDVERIHFRHSFDVGSVRLTERFVRGDVVAPEEERAMAGLLETTFAALPAPPPRAVVVGVAGTVTTLFAVAHRIEPYDAARVHRGELTFSELVELRKRLGALPLAERRVLPGLQPKRADVIPAGALILEKALERLGSHACGVSDRGLRWGLLAARFGRDA